MIQSVWLDVGFLAPAANSSLSGRELHSPKKAHNGVAGGSKWLVGVV